MEHELKKHIHNIVKETLNRKRSLWRRVGEILIEILIIVFAVSFAVYMEKERERAHDKKEVKEFLLGLKADLENDRKEMNEDIWGYETSAKWLSYFVYEKNINKDSLKAHSWVLVSKTHLLANKGRYEGFKASGKMNTIENHELRNRILDFYEERIVGLTNSTQDYMDFKDQMLNIFYRERKGRATASDNLYDILKHSELNNYLATLSNVNEITKRYKLAINDAESIIKLINEMYPTEKK
jgi:hypothetical protein